MVSYPDMFIVQDLRKIWASYPAMTDKEVLEAASLTVKILGFKSQGE